MPESDGSRYNVAYNIANNLLRLSTVVDEEAIEKAIESVKAIPDFAGLDFEMLREDLEANNNVHVGGYAILDDLDYKAWLADKKEKSSFRFAA